MTSTEITGRTVEHKGFEVREILDTRGLSPRPVGWDLYRDGARLYVGYPSAANACQMIDLGAFDKVAR